MKFQWELLLQALSLAIATSRLDSCCAPALVQTCGASLKSFSPFFIFAIFFARLTFEPATLFCTLALLSENGHECLEGWREEGERGGEDRRNVGAWSLS